jgi:uracil-DNA glycosylase family 4
MVLQKRTFEPAMLDETRAALIAALEWHLAEGIGEALEDAAQDATAKPVITLPLLPSPSPPPTMSAALKEARIARGGEGRGEGVSAPAVEHFLHDSLPPLSIPHASTHPHPRPTPGQAHNPLPKGERGLLGSMDIRNEARKLALAASTLEDLRAAIQTFDGIALKRTATNMVFADGNPSAPVMLIGEAPGADEDRIGKPFVGVSGQLLDRIFSHIGLSRAETDPVKSLYIANILNWRPPGNRTPSAGEIEASLPFIERHIALVKPKLLILCGGVSAQALLNRTEGISKLRNRWHDYLPRTEGIAGDNPASIPAIATYHPAYLLRTPSQKRAVWQDMLALAERLPKSAD